MNEHAGVARNFSFVYTLPVYVRVCFSSCVCVGVTMKKKCQTNGKHDKRHRRYFK